MSLKIYGPMGRDRKLGKKGTRNCRLLQKFKTIDGVLYQLHATKGWRPADRDSD